MKSALAFVASHIQVVGDLPTTLIPGLVFRKASDEEIALIRETIQMSIRSSLFKWVPYDANVHKETRGTANVKTSTFRLEPLPPEKWKYWVVAYELDQQPQKFERIGQLLPIDLEFAFHLHFSESSQQGRVVSRTLIPTHLLDKYSSVDYDYEFPDAASITTQQLATLGELWALHKKMAPDYAFISTALDNFSALRRIPTYSDLSIVGLFSIIETLTTHKPRLTETLDSITHQISNKLILLRKLYARKISIDQYFFDAAEEKIWKKLYGYRSSIAHGNTANFEGEYQVLKDHSTVINFLRDNVKELIAYALRNPEFVSDLRRC